MQSRLLRRLFRWNVPFRMVQNQPSGSVKFSESPAFKQYKSGVTPVGAGGKTYRGWTPYEDINRYAVVFSTAIFLVYFGILREENDVDETLYDPLWKKLPKLEMDNLRTLIAAGEAKNQDVSEHRKRLAQLENETRIL